MVSREPAPVEMVIGQATPGPWVYRPHQHDDWGWVRGGVPDEDGHLPLVACARSGVFDATDYAEHRRSKTDPFEANARLIAAAPDMLVALKVLDAQWSEDRPNGPDTKSRPGHPEMHWTTKDAWRQIRAAIAKAEGRT